MTRGQGFCASAVWLSRDVCHPVSVHKRMVKDRLKYSMQWIVSFQGAKHKQTAVPEDEHFLLLQLDFRGMAS